MALTINSWQNYKWVEYTGDTEVEVIQPTYRHDTIMIYTELISGSVQITARFIDDDIPDDKSFSYSRLNSSDEIEFVPINVTTAGEFAIPLPNEYNQEKIKIKFVSTSTSAAEFNAWIKPASSSMRGIK